MSELYCDRCGKTLDQGNGLGGCCARCLMEKGLESTSGSVETTVTFETLPQQERRGFTAPASIGRYRILRLIGEGAMGFVYEAEQEHPRRTVALKILKPGIASSTALRRFELEAEALGRLQHPGIAQIYEAGTADTGFGPQPYFAMELIRGRTPVDYVKEHNLGIRERLELVMKTAEAVHHAHQRGLIHRDLKPSNILVDQIGQPKVLDFGVARAIDEDAQRTQRTDAGQLVGTLAYMSPEQVLADPDEIDIRSDVYALGTLLYELLAGKLPLDMRRKLPEVIHAIREEDPVPLGRLDRRYRGDIETIAIKALEKDKTQRYTSAAELAADIRRYLNDEPIAARRPTAKYQLLKFARRNKALVFGLAGVIVALAAGATVSTYLAITAERERQHALVEQQAAKDERDHATEAKEAAKEQRDIAIAAEDQARRERDHAIAERLRADAAADTARKLRLATIWQSLARESLRDVTRRLDDDRTALLAVQALRFNLRLPGQPQYLSEDALQQAARLESPSHDILSGNMTFAVAMSLDGLIAAGGRDNLLRLWDLHKPGEPPVLLQSPGGAAIRSLAFSRDRRWLAAGLDRNYFSVSLTGNAVLLWSLKNLDAPPTVILDASGRSYVAFSPDSNFLAAGTDRRGVQVWNMRDLHAPPLTFPVKYPELVNALEFSPDSARLAVSSGDTIQLWDAHDLSAIPMSFQIPPDPAKSAPSQRWGAVKFSPDGMHLAGANPDVLAEWDMRRPQSPPVLLRARMTGGFYGAGVTYSPNGDRLTISMARTILVWNPRNPNAAPAEFQTLSSINSLAYSADGTRLAAATSSGLSMLEVGNSSETQPTTVHTQPNSVLDLRRGTVVYSPDLTRLAAPGEDGVRVLDLRDSALSPVTVSEWRVDSVAFSLDNMRLAGITNVDKLWMWDLRNPAATPRSLGRFDVFAFSPDGLRIAARGASNIINIWDLRMPDAAPAQIQTHLQTNGRPSLTFTPDSRRLVFSSDKVTQVWDLSRVSSALVTFSAPNLVRSITISADGTRIAGLDPASGSVGVWDLHQPGTPLAVFQPQFGSALVLSFSPDGSRLAAGMAAGIEMWDLRNPSAPAVLLQQRGFLIIEAVSFSSDGTRLTAGNNNGAVVMWHLSLDAADYLCRHVWRNLSMNEWAQYVGDDIPYERTCPALPPGVGAPGTATR
jgi:WD40 repeat protein